MTDGYISAKCRTSYLIIVSYREGVYIGRRRTLEPSTPRRPSSSSHVREDRRGVGRLPSVKGFNKTMSSSLGESNMCMMVRSSSKLFWNGFPDRIIRFLIQSSARAFRISLFGRPLLNWYQKADYSIRDSIPKQLCRTSYQHALVTSG